MFTGLWSLSSWRAWIEMLSPEAPCPHVPSLSSWRAWIEIDDSKLLCDDCCSRSPHGERGLKWHFWHPEHLGSASLSSWRAWIEIRIIRSALGICSGSLSSWRAWIEIRYEPLSRLEERSLSSWRAWIEITTRSSNPTSCGVALLMESVD